MLRRLSPGRYRRSATFASRASTGRGRSSRAPSGPVSRLGQAGQAVDGGGVRLVAPRRPLLVRPGADPAPQLVALALEIEAGNTPAATVGDAREPHGDDGSRPLEGGEQPH